MCDIVPRPHVPENVAGSQKRRKCTVQRISVALLAVSVGQSSQIEKRPWSLLTVL